MSSRSLLIGLGVVCVAGFIAWNLRDRLVPFFSGGKPRVQNTPSPVVDASKPKFPMAPPEGKSEPPPKLDESDPDVRKNASELFGQTKLDDVLSFDNFIRNVVVAVENATGRQIPINRSPVKPASGTLVVSKAGDYYILDPKNESRYAPYMDVVRRANLQKIVEYYRRTYPLFQAAYQELGMQGYFNDKVVEVLDRISATPLVKGPLQLQIHGIRYEFADPDLESLSAIEKIVLRLGTRNGELLRRRSKELRSLLTESAK